MNSKLRLRGCPIELATLVLVVLVAAGVWIFAAIADQVLEGGTAAFDTRILLALRNPDDLSDPIGPPWVEELFRDLTALGGVAVTTLLVGGALGWLLIARRRRLALFLGLSVTSGLAVSLLMKSGFDRPRPTLVEHHSAVYTQSFPSGHSMTAAVVYLTLAALLARAQPAMRLKVYTLAMALLLTVLVGVSRVYVGVHWPTDVLAGWAGGGTWALLCALIARSLQRRGRIEPEEAAPAERGPEPRPD